MNDRDVQFRLGIGALVASAVFIFIAIPTLVSAPSNVRNIILSPLFWPYALAGFTGLIGFGLLAIALRTEKSADKVGSDVDNRAMAYMRLFGVAVIMIVTVYAMPRVGLVWMAMLVFAATAFLVRTSHPITALICAVVIPLVLYTFFAHVAGVAIPQGNFVRLP
ncbi:MAG: tripartite tricarboxylate transporter TctB family protein [Paracoccaceae bacterium]|nr:tripartite tricarboxylate transporter TctB family protein [Paracoccaceae bacterium]